VKNQDVVHVNDDASSRNKVIKNIIHHVLKSSRGIAKAEEHVTSENVSIVDITTGACGLMTMMVVK
jgi:mannitol-1-phosphate/altronate dehydrogenase